MNENQIEIDREQLKNERKIRKKLKKEKAREENKKELEKAALLKLQSTDHRIKIITEKPINSKPQIQCSCVNLENDTEQFPSLNVTAKQRKIKIKHNHNENCSLSISTSVTVNKKSNAPISVNIAEAIENIKKPPVINKKFVKKFNDNQISGNILDSDNPQRKHGKIRENKKPHLSQLKKQIIKEKNCLEMCENKNDKIDIVCDNLITPELNSYVEHLLKDIADFYYRQFQNLTKTVYKKRFIVGFHEIEKYLPTKNVKLLIIASNLQPFDVLIEKIQKFKDLALNYNIPYVFALSRRHMARCLRKQTPVSCVAILNYFGSEENYQQIIELLDQAKMKNENSSVLIYDQHKESNQKENEINQKMIETLANKIEKTDLI